MTIEELKSHPAYSLLLVLRHDEMLPFISDQFKGKSKVVWGYLALNVVLALAIIGFGIVDVWQGKIEIWRLLAYFFTSPVIGFVALVILHESLHGLAYWLAGARRISFGANWRKCYFYAVADRFVTKRNAFFFVALLPFVFISVLVIAPLPFVEIHWKWALLGVLFLHTGACAGDFAMLAFYEMHHQANELITYDDVSEKRSYFFVRE